LTDVNATVSNKKKLFKKNLFFIGLLKTINEKSRVWSGSVIQQYRSGSVSEHHRSRKPERHINLILIAAETFSVKSTQHSRK
jgi:hypothetical protein